MPDLEFISFLNDSQKDYRSIWDFQKGRIEKIASGNENEAIIFCEHERLITTGRRYKSGNILDQSLPTYDIERGGDVTYHGPGQLVIYPLIKLNGDLFSHGLHEYLRFCEQLVINLLESFSLDAGRYGPTGVWIKEEGGLVKKIASIGVAVRKWVTYHGIALNVSCDLDDFKKIRPCDFEASVMTSLKDQGINLELIVVSELIKKEMIKLLNPAQPLEKTARSAESYR